MKLYEATVTVKVVFGSEYPPNSIDAMNHAAKELQTNGIAERVRVKELKRPSDTTEIWRDSYPWAAPKKTVREFLTKGKAK